MSHRLRLHWCSLCAVIFSVLLFSACNDAPSIVGSEVIEPTDSAFAAGLSKITSDSVQMFSGDSTFTERLVLPLPSAARGPLFLGSTANSDARLLLSLLSDEFSRLNKDSVVWSVTDNGLRRKPDTTFKMLATAIAQDSVVVASCRLIFSAPSGVHVFGDTLDSTLSFRAYEITKPFSAFATWDSIYDAAGNTTLYDIGQQPLGQFVRASSTTVTEFQIDAGYMKRMLKLGIDPATSDKAYGIALHPQSMKSIQHVGGSYVLSVELQKIGSSRRTWTRQFSLAATNVLQTPAAGANEAVIQGPRRHVAKFLLNLDALDTSAVIFDAEMSFPIDINKTAYGSNFATMLDNALFEVYSPVDNADTVEFDARIATDRSKIVVSNLGWRRKYTPPLSPRISLGKFLHDYVHKPGKKQPIYVAIRTYTRFDRVQLKPTLGAAGQRPFLRIYYSRGITP